MRQHDNRVGSRSGDSLVQRQTAGISPGKRTLVESISVPVQRRAAEGPSGEPSRGSSGAEARVHAAAERGTQGGGGPLPHLDTIQRSFGRHDVTGVSAHVGGAATEACDAMGAQAYATGTSAAFAGAPDLHTAAHEAAHIVQQRGGVQLKGGVGEANDQYERHADAVADLVVQGKSAESALDTMASGGGTRAAAQRVGSREHQTLGDNASGGATYDLCGPSPAIDTSAYNRAFHLTHGDIVMLSGDFFSPRDTRTTASGGTEPDPD